MNCYRLRDYQRKRPIPTAAGHKKVSASSAPLQARRFFIVKRNVNKKSEGVEEKLTSLPGWIHPLLLQYLGLFYNFWFYLQFLGIWGKARFFVGFWRDLMILYGIDLGGNRFRIESDGKIEKSFILFIIFWLFCDFLVIFSDSWQFLNQNSRGGK